MTNDRHRIAVSARLRPEDAEAVLGIVESDPLEETGKHFMGRGWRLRLHADWQTVRIAAGRAISAHELFDALRTGTVRVAGNRELPLSRVEAEALGAFGPT